MIICDLEKRVVTNKNTEVCHRAHCDSPCIRKCKLEYLECFFIYKQSGKCKDKTKPQKTPEGALGRERKECFSTSTHPPFHELYNSRQRNVIKCLSLHCVLLFGVSCLACLD